MCDSQLVPLGGTWGVPGTPFSPRPAGRSWDVAHRRAARIITGTPSGSPAAATCRDADLTPLSHIAEEEAAKVLHRYRQLDSSHYLNATATRTGRSRLRSQGNSVRPDWRTTASSRLSEIPQGASVATALADQREARALAEYRRLTPVDSTHWRATGGSPLRVPPGSSRADEVTLFQARVNRLTSLEQTKFRHGRADSPLCPHCDLSEEEDTEHLMLRCPAWSAHREATLGPDASLMQLQSDPGRFLEFYARLGPSLSPPPPNQ